MPPSRQCPRCGAPLRPDAVEGLCPGCLLDLALNPDGGPPPQPGPPDPAGLADHFPHLEILGVLGQGGMGVVYHARQPHLDRPVALKILTPGVSRDPAFAERFTREARALARLDHPGIVAVHDFGQAGGRYYLVMQFVDGANLRQILRAGRLSPAEALRIVPQVCAALQYAHDQGVVHRDIKPENILVDRRGHVKIADFGLAKLAGDEPLGAPLTGPGQVMGTLHYMAPEQLERPREVDHRADIYSLGVVFYELLTGELPLGRFAPPSRKAAVDGRLDQVVLRALEKEPARRYQHAGDVKTEVEALAPVTPESEVPTLLADTVSGPAAGEADAQLSPGYRWKALTLVAGVYGVSFALPAFRFYTSWDNGPHDHGWVGGGTSYGGECFRQAWVMEWTSWYANPCLWLACLLLLRRQWLGAALLGGIAVGLGLNAWDPFGQSRYLIGYWTWLTSMAIAVGAGLYAWWIGRGGRRGRPADGRPA